MSSSTVMNEINNLIKNEQYTDASILFLSVIEALKKNHSPLLPEFSFKYAHFLFEMQEYELSLIMFQSAYNSNYLMEEIEGFLYNSFILPNNEEFKETYNNHLNLYNDHIISSYIPSFDELPIDFIPFNEDKYLMFNNKSKVFEGIIDISNDSLNNFETINYDDEFSDIVITDCWDIGIPKNCILSLKDRIIYHISLDIKMSLSFLKIPKIMERYCPNLKFIDSLHSFQSYFHNNHSIYLPHLYYGKNSSGTDINIDKILEEEHHYRLTSKGRNTSNVILTIGIPSYNRGHRLLQCIQSLMQLQYDAEIEFVISNNGSVEYVDVYDEISKIKDSRIHYFRFPNNVGANLNFCQVLKMSHGKYTCLLSDEDSIHLPSITHYLNVLKNNPNIGLASSCGLGYYRRSACQTFNMGREAFLRSFLTTNYVSGLIFRSDLVHSLDIYQWTLDNISVNKAVYYYSHSCWVMFFALSGDYYEDNLLLFMEGSPEEDQDLTPISNTLISKPMLPYSTIESRIEQHNGFIDILNQLISSIDFETYLTAYISLCYKTIFLLSLVEPKYIDNGISWTAICNKVTECCYNGISKIDLNLTDDDKKILIIEIDKMISTYRK